MLHDIENYHNVKHNEYKKPESDDDRSSLKPSDRPELSIVEDSDGATSTTASQ